MPKVRVTASAATYFCPGCKENKRLTFDTWRFNGDAERPTFSPSVLIIETVTTDGRKLAGRCHSFVRDGRIEFLGDCDHELRGRTVDVPEWPSAARAV